MVKIKKSNQITIKAEAVKKIEDKLASTQTIDNKPISDDAEEWTDDPERWNGFKERYADEFENQLNLLDSIMTKKKNKLKVTWISVIKKK